MKTTVAIIAALACTFAVAQTSINQKGPLTLTKDGAAISTHTDERNATEKAFNTGPGTYLLKRTDVEIKVPGAVAPPVTTPTTQPPPAPSTATTLPKVYLDTTYAAPTGATITVGSGGNLQAALDNAKPGDTIVLQAGATFTGPFTLRDKGAFTQWIHIRSSAVMPAPGMRVTPANASSMATIVGTGSPVVALQTQASAHHYRLIGIEFKPAAGAFSFGLIRLGAGETSAAAIPHDIVIDRCYIHGDPGVGGRRGIALNSAATAVVDSYLSDWKEAGSDSQAIAIWNSPGPVKLANNYIEGAGENLLIGGADPTIAQLVPADIEVRGNYFAKPVAWRSQSWTIKNLFELKNARRVLVEGNVFEYTWAAAQSFGINIKSSNQDNTAPWSVTEDLTFRNNVMRHVPSAIKFCGVACDGTPTGQGSRYLVQNNLFEDVSAAEWGGDGVFLQTLGNTPSLVIDRNTVMNSGSFFSGGDGGVNPGFRFTNNVVQRGTNGFKGTGTADGNGTLAVYFPGAVFTNNAIVGGNASAYPAGNTFPATYADAAKDVGADMTLVNAATRCAVTGVCSQ